MQESALRYLCGLAVVVGWTSAIPAADFWWRNAVNVGNWDDPVNWSTNSATESVGSVPGASDTARLNRQLVSQTMLGRDGEWTVGDLAFTTDRNTTTFDLTNCVLHSSGGIHVNGTGWTPGPHLLVKNGTLDACGKNFDIGNAPSLQCVTVELAGPGAIITNAILYSWNGPNETLVVSNGARVLASQFVFGGPAGTNNIVTFTGAGTLMTLPSLTDVSAPRFSVGDQATGMVFTVSDGAQLVFPEKFPSQLFRIGGHRTQFVVDSGTVTNLGGYLAINGDSCELRVQNESRVYVHGADGYFWIDGSGNRLIVDHSLFQRLWVAANIPAYALSVGWRVTDTRNQILVQNGSVFRDTTGFFCVGYDGSDNGLAVSNSVFVSEGTVVVGFTTNAVGNQAVFENALVSAKALEVRDLNGMAVGGTNTQICVSNMTFSGSADLTFTIPAQGYQAVPLQCSRQLTFDSGTTTIRVTADAFARAEGGWVTLASSANDILYRGSIKWVLPEGAAVSLEDPKLIRVHFPSPKQWMMRLE